MGNVNNAFIQKTSCSLKKPKPLIRQIFFQQQAILTASKQAIKKFLLPPQVGEIRALWAGIESLTCTSAPSAVMQQMHFSPHFRSASRRLHQNLITACRWWVQKSIHLSGEGRRAPERRRSIARSFGLGWIRLHRRHRITGTGPPAAHLHHMRSALWSFFNLTDFY